MHTTVTIAKNEKLATARECARSIPLEDFDPGDPELFRTDTISGSIYALNEYPNQHRKLKENPELIDNFVQKVMRWQTAVAHMRRSAVANVEFRRKQKGDKVVMWCICANEDAIKRPMKGYETLPVRIKG